MRIGYFGGSFDPPHRGHLRVALAAAERFGLERVLLAPTGNQPFKPGGAAAAFADRLEMVRLLVEGSRVVEASAMDASRADGEANFTVDALERLRAEVGDEAAVFSIVGVDAFVEIRRWRAPERLFELAEWVVVSRPGFAVDAIEGVGLTPEQRRRVHVLDGIDEDVSATRLRELLRDGADVTGLVPEAVLKYIRARGLYQ